MPSNTPNLELYMKNPATDGNDYFDVETMMNDNWEKIDDFAGVMDSVKERLDTIARTDITLQPGLQVIEAAKTAPFSLEYLTGRMLVNLLGRYGGCESLGPWEANVSLITDATKRTSGMSSFRLTIGSVAATATITFNTRPGLYYVFASDVQVPTGVSVSLGVIGATSVSTTTAGSWQPLAHRFVATDYFHQLRLSFTGPSGSVCWMDSVRVYEVSEADYNAMASMALPERAAKYPYVDSVKPVRNPYAIRYGENLLPPFYEWESFGANKTITGSYNMTLTSDAASGYPLRVFIPVVPGQSYTLTAVTTGFSGQPRAGVYSYFTDASKARLTDRDYNQTKTAPTQVAYIEVVLNNDISASSSGTTTILAGTFTFRDIMLNIGSEPLPFVPREDSMLALQTDLYADPLTGANADSVYERDGQYFKNKRWERVTLDGSLPWQVDNAYPGWRQLSVRNVLATSIPATKQVVKYDGKSLASFSDTLNTGDQVYTGSNQPGNLHITVNNSDSGWGDSYNDLTVDEIKAYFMGWVMYQFVNSGSSPVDGPYNGTGTKYWAYRRGDGTYAGGTGTLPITPAPNWTPYELVYQLATPTVEPIVSEGQLTLNEGSNQVEVGTGIVLRERSATYQEATTGTWNINNGTSGWEPSLLKNKASKILVIYRGDKKDSTWTITNSLHTSAGAIAQQLDEYHDLAAAYSVTYLMLDTSPVATFSGSVADNEKALLADLVQDVQQASTRLSVVENKKAEKDSPAWITPTTLLNGWVSMGVLEYRKIDNVVHMRARIRSGVIGQQFMVLPIGYRPLKSEVRPVQTYTTTDIFGAIIIGADGRVIVSGGSNQEVNIYVSFFTD